MLETLEAALANCISPIKFNLAALVNKYDRDIAKKGLLISCLYIHTYSS